MLTLFRISTGDNWNGILKDTLRIIDDPESHCRDEADGCILVKVLSPFYFVSFVLVAQFVLINVVVAVLMRQLEDSHTKAEINPQQIEAELEGKVVQLEKIVQEQCPELVQRLQLQIGADKNDALSLISTEYMLREPDKMGDELAEVEVHRDVQRTSSQRSHRHHHHLGKLPNRHLTFGAFDADSYRRGWQPGYRRERHSSSGDSSPSTVVDHTRLSQVFKDLGEQLKAEIQENEAEESNEFQVAKQSDIARNALLLAENEKGELNSDETMQLIRALADKRKSAVDIFVDLKRKELVGKGSAKSQVQRRMSLREEYLERQRLNRIRRAKMKAANRNLVSQHKQDYGISMRTRTSTV